MENKENDHTNGALLEFSEVIDLSSRTCDVKTSGSFENLMISQSIVANLNKHGFMTPSPVQMEAIPTALSGKDILVQAKSGTGKTLVFAILAVEGLNTAVRDPQRLILAPTREIALQITDTIQKISPKGVKIAVTVGGTNLAGDIEIIKKGVHIVVGSTGRVAQLINEGYLPVSGFDLFVLDEADKLMAEDFLNDVNFVFSSLPAQRQVAVFSATFPPALEQLLAKFMGDATLIKLNPEDVQLVGVKQYVQFCTKEEPAYALVRLMNSIQFTQAIVFVNFATECEPICNALVEAGYEASMISAKMCQTDRQSVIERLKNGKIKIVVSTDLTARGVDSSYTNVVVSIEAAMNPETYFHRIGRAARFGGLGAAVTLVCDPRGTSRFGAMAFSAGARVKVLKAHKVPYNLPTNDEFYESCELFRSMFERDGDKSRRLAIERGEANIPVITEVPPLTSETRKPKYAYSKETLRDIGAFACKPEQNLRYYIHDLGISLEQDFGADLMKLKESMAAQNIKDNQNRLNTRTGTSEGFSQNETQPQKRTFKFVPSRSKAKTKFFMRGELTSIRDKFCPAEWKAYAETKFNLKEEPFVAVIKSDDSIDCSQDKERVVTSNVNRSHRSPTFDSNVYNRSNGTIIGPPNGKWNPLRDDGIMRYSRKQLIGVQMKTPGKVWLQYVKSKWDTRDEPWELDQFMRCSYEERLRKQRGREKMARKEVMEERKKVLEKRETVASSRFITRYEVLGESFAEFCELEAAEFARQAEKAATDIGPVICERDSREEWRTRIGTLAAAVAAFNSRFRQSVKRSQDQVADKAVGDDHDHEAEEESVSTRLKTEVEENNSSVCVNDVDTNELCSIDAVAEGPPIKEYVEISEEGTNNQPHTSMENIGEIECSAARPGEDLLENGLVDDNVDITTDDCDNSVAAGEILQRDCSQSESERSFQIREEGYDNELMRFAAAYRRNVDFYTVFNMYLSNIHHN